MKYILLILYISISFNAYSQKNLSEKAKELKRLKTRDYKGKTFETLLQNKKTNSYTLYFWIDEPPACLSGIVLKYEKNLYLYVYIENPKYQERFNEKGDWSFEKFKKEKIRRIEVRTR